MLSVPRTFALGFAAVLAAGALPAMAAQPGDAAATSDAASDPQLSVPVSYADLDVASRAGRVELGRRVAEAVDAVCPLAVPADHAAFIDRQRCRRVAFDAVRSQNGLAARDADGARRRVARAD